ncbi:MAG TPA: GNAT family N-acetyltransferase [Acidimicrobiales bacterium]|jgi:hypothetical protein|nr:GNAT family N-acetyltransferase [Acidimicrobiales bacterium]
MMSVRDNPQSSRYELVVDGEVAGIADYTLEGDRLVIPHTEIDARRRGRGLGAVMVQGVLEDVRASGRTVVPLCWYVAQYIDEHPEFGDLVASRS